MGALDFAGPLALKLIAKFGTSIVITTQVQGAYNPATGSQALTSNSQTVTGLIEEYADSIRFLGDKLNKGDAIIDGDKKVTIAAQALSFIPKAGDSFLIASQGYGVTGVASMWAGQSIAAYVFHIRRA